MNQLSFDTGTDLRCTPEQCPHCLPWGPTVAKGTKTKCMKVPESWFSTTLGGPCMRQKPRRK